MAVRGKKAKARQIKHLVIGITALLFVLVVMGGLLYHNLTKDSGLNITTLCPASGPKGHYVLLLDKTDPLNFTQKQAFSVFLDDLVHKKVPEGHLLSVFVLSEDFKTTAEPVVELCNPGTGESVSAMTGNVKRARRTYEEKFIKPLMEQSETFLGTKPATASPVFEMLQLAAINGFRKHDVKGARKLFLMSDMLHNSSAFSMYRSYPDFDDFAATDYGRKTKVDLQGVEVELYYLLNSPQLQTRRNLLFWEKYFTNYGARLIAVRPLEG